MHNKKNYPPKSGHLIADYMSQCDSISARVAWPAPIDIPACAQWRFDCRPMADASCNSQFCALTQIRTRLVPQLWDSLGAHNLFHPEKRWQNTPTGSLCCRIVYGVANIAPPQRFHSELRVLCLTKTAPASTRALLAKEKWLPRPLQRGRV